uniref:Reverse transcriptase Ty1/copia-type domain-containing protein n=1 Tax=Tanacetum cinerariifolium TaxID=118510 RepID=A0A6L2LUQ2_TANCI|nr:hypothetical protein [Tanacetum cinerariifolium]
MPKLEDITYFDDKEVVGAEADFTNLETTITVSPIPTTRVHKDHPVTQIIAYASFMGFMVYQMDVKSAFLYGTIEEEVYVCQPLGFEDPDYPDKRGKIDQTLFIKRQKGDILLVQIHVDDIIFGSTNKDLCKDFEKLIKDKFQMSSMGELTFFLGLHVKQKPDGFFISQDKYVAEILRKFGLTDGKSASTPIDTEKPLLKDPDGEGVDVHTYRSMIGSLMYLTSSRPDIMFVVCACAHFQYPKDSPFNLVAYSDSDYVSASLDRKSTTGGCQFLGCRLISWQCKKQTVVATSSTEADLVRNVDSSTKFHMYLRFLQLVIKAQVDDLSLHSTTYSSLALTQKVFANIRRVGKGFSRVETPLFEGMIVAQQDDDVADEGAASVDDVPAAVDESSILSPTPTTQPPSQELPYTSQVIPTLPPSPIAQPPSPQQQLQPSHDAEILMDLLHTLLETCTTLTRRVEHLEQDKIAQTLRSQREIIATIDTDEDVTLKNVAAIAAVEKDVKIEENADDDELEPAELKEVVKVVTTAKLMTEVVTAASATITAADTLITAATITAAPSATRRFKMDYFKGMSYDDIRPIFEKYFNSNMAFLEKNKEQMEEEDNKALKRNSKSQAEKAAKKQKLDEEVPVVDYEIYTENNKPYYNIIRADRSPQLFLSFLSLLRNFNREDLEVLWQLVKERFASSKPKNFSDDFLLTTLTYMFEKPDIQAQVWKNQRSVHGLAKVKSWRLLESYGVHIITFTTTQMILLVERRYPLTRFTLDQMLNNVRLKVKEESKVSLELLSFVRQQQQERFRLE